MYTLIVSLQVRPEKRDRFLAAITENAAASVRDEPGCLRFDVMEHAQQPNQFYFYEVYRDTDGFAAHKAAPHFAAWRRAAEGAWCRAVRSTPSPTSSSATPPRCRHDRRLTRPPTRRTADVVKHRHHEPRYRRRAGALSGDDP